MNMTYSEENQSERFPPNQASTHMGKMAAFVEILGLPNIAVCAPITSIFSPKMIFFINKMYDSKYA